MAGLATSLPARIPIFPLAGVLLLPGGKLPLHIFEPRYRDMIRDALSGERLIGMVQPTDPARGSPRPEIYRTGCAGRIVEDRETEDGRFYVTLHGLCRFRIAEELAVATRYRQVAADWTPYRGDVGASDEDGRVDRARLLPALRAYLQLAGIPADWKAVEGAPSAALVNYLSMICPFSPSEKQALLEAADVFERGRVMTALIEMAVLAKAGGREDEQPKLN
jgi:Lon protease-like protein